MSSAESQLASSVLMISPASFESNPLTAESNRFQNRSELPQSEQQALAEQQFAGLVQELRAHAVEVIVVQDRADQQRPDAIFPNNWVSFHADGRVVLYPMEAENRRTERRLDIIESLTSEYGFHVSEIVDLTAHEADGHFLEGTGSMVLDRANHTAYACLSSRTHLDPLGDFAQRLDYEVIAFDAVDRDGAPVYHTNVMMNVGESLAVVCVEAIAREDQRQAVQHSLETTGHDVLELSFGQMHAFAGNMLELRSAGGERLLAMSQQAYNSLTSAQLDVLHSNGEIVTSPIDDIEQLAGGSVRCMLAEIHLPRDAEDNK